LPSAADENEELEFTLTDTY